MTTTNPSASALSGVLVLYASMWIISSLDASAKWLLAGGAPLLMVVWMRYVVHFVFIAFLIVASRKKEYLQSQVLRWQWARGLAMLLATFTFFSTLRFLPQAQATAIIFIAPLLMLVLAPWLLGERRQVSRWIAAAAGFVGVLIVIRPSAGLNTLGVALGLTTAFLFALQHICSRRVASDHPLTTLLWSGLIGSLAVSFVLPFAWGTLKPALQTLSPTHWLLMTSLGISGGVGHLLQVQAFRMASASFLAPFIYLQITAATTLGWLIWGDFPDGMTWIGIAIICISGASIATYEWRKRRQTSAGVSGNAKRPA